MLRKLCDLPRAKRLGFVWRGTHDRIRGSRHGDLETAIILKPSWRGAITGVKHSPGYWWSVVKQDHKPHPGPHWAVLIHSELFGDMAEAAEIAMIAWEAFFEGEGTHEQEDTAVR
jgi:hypothetical protein